jgi:hypothetical protein
MIGKGEFINNPKLISQGFCFAPCLNCGGLGGCPGLELRNPARRLAYRSKNKRRTEVGGFLRESNWSFSQYFY